MQAELPTSTEPKAIKNLKQIARQECIVPGTSVCGGCGGLAALRLAAKVLGPKTVFVNAAGCFTLLAVFPYTPFKGSWLYTTMASAAAGAREYAMRSMCCWHEGLGRIQAQVDRYWSAAA